MDLIFWFSATGNSLYAAKQLSGKFGNAQLIQQKRQFIPPPVDAGGSLPFLLNHGKECAVILCKSVDKIKKIGYNKDRGKQLEHLVNALI